MGVTVSKDGGVEAESGWRGGAKGGQKRARGVVVAG